MLVKFPTIFSWLLQKRIFVKNSTNISQNNTTWKITKNMFWVPRAELLSTVLGLDVIVIVTWIAQFSEGNLRINPVNIMKYLYWSYTNYNSFIGNAYLYRYSIQWSNVSYVCSEVWETGGDILTPFLYCTLIEYNNPQLKYWVCSLVCIMI